MSDPFLYVLLPRSGATIKHDKPKLTLPDFSPSIKIIELVTTLNDDAFNPVNPLALITLTVEPVDAYTFARPVAPFPLHPQTVALA